MLLINYTSIKKKKLQSASRRILLSGGVQLICFVNQITWPSIYFSVKLWLGEFKIFFLSQCSKYFISFQVLENRVFILLFYFCIYLKYSLRKQSGNSLVVQWLGLCALTAEGLGSIPGRETKIPQAMRRGQKQNKTKQSAHLQQETAPSSVFLPKGRQYITWQKVFMGQ